MKNNKAMYYLGIVILVWSTVILMINAFDVYRADLFTPKNLITHILLLLLLGGFFIYLSNKKLILPNRVVFFTVFLIAF